MDIDVVMFEVEDRTITLRVEEWVTITCVLELYTGGSCLPVESEIAARVQERIFEQLCTRGAEDDGERERS